jgi:hypothetical protein
MGRTPSSHDRKERQNKKTGDGGCPKKLKKHKQKALQREKKDQNLSINQFAIPCKRSLKMDFALSKEGFLELNLASFRVDHKTLISWKKIVATLFLPKTSLPLERRSQMAVAERR